MLPSVKNLLFPRKKSAVGFRHLLLGLVLALVGQPIAMNIAHAQGTVTDPSFSDIKELIVTQKMTSIADVIAALKARYPAYLDHHTLAYASRSLQNSSFTNPRALVFGSTAKTIIAFNGDPQQRGYSKLEIMSFQPNDKNKKYAFREITFLKEPGASVDLDPEEIESRSADIVISKPNPIKCLDCHGSENPRPIWGQYARWPGFYGSDEDHLFLYLFKDDKLNAEIPPESSGESNFDIEGPDVEKAGYILYLQNKLMNPRYKYLPPPTGVRPAAYGDSKMNDGINFPMHPNESLNRLFSSQLIPFMTADLNTGTEAPKRLALIAATICFAPGHGRLNSSPSQWPEKLRFLADSFAKLQPRFVDDKNRVIKYNLQRELAALGGKLRYPIESYLAHADDFTGDSAAALLGAAFNSLGLELTNYTVNAKAQLNFFDDGGGEVFPGLQDQILDLLRTKFVLDHKPTCSEVNSYL